MTKKRIRQMNAALLRRLSLRPAAEYLAGREETAAQLVGEGVLLIFDKRLNIFQILVQFFLVIEHDRFLLSHIHSKNPQRQKAHCGCAKGPRGMRDLATVTSFSIAGR